MSSSEQNADEQIWNKLLVATLLLKGHNVVPKNEGNVVTSLIRKPDFNILVSEFLYTAQILTMLIDSIRTSRPSNPGYQLPKLSRKSRQNFTVFCLTRHCVILLLIELARSDNWRQGFVRSIDTSNRDIRWSALLIQGFSYIGAPSQRFSFTGFHRLKSFCFGGLLSILNL